MAQGLLGIHHEGGATEGACAGQCSDGMLDCTCQYDPASHILHLTYVDEEGGGTVDVTSELCAPPAVQRGDPGSSTGE